MYFDKKYLNIFSVLMLIVPVLFLYAQEGMKVKTLTVLPNEGTNDYYIGNRSPLLASPLVKLPIGSIKPDGWVKKQLELEAEGFSGHLTEISRWCKYEGSAWISNAGEGHSGWEELPYWLKGFIDLGYVLNDKRIVAEATRWVEGVLTSQDSIGYFGPRRNLIQPDIWPNMIMLWVLRTHFDATKDKRVIPFILNYARWLNHLPLERYLPGSWQKIRGGDNLDILYWLYNQTGEKWLLDVARVNHERTSDWVGGVASWHGVNICQSFREPAQYYQQTKDMRYLKATERNYKTVMDIYGQVPGGMFGADENARAGYTDPRQAAETCSMVEFINSFQMLLRISGSPVWADRCEDVAFNSLPAAMTPDLKGLHYLTAPNLIQLDRTGKAPIFDNDGDMLSYNPHDYRCCQHNVAFGFPYFAENLWMATANNGLAAVFFAPSTVTARVGKGVEVTITEKTKYPFDETIEFRFSMSKSVAFPFLMRVPGWCEKPKVFINGKEISFDSKPLSWIILERMWKEGDEVRLELPQTVTVKVWRKNNNAVSVHRGPLTYSLKIGERWHKYGGTEEFPAFEVLPTTPWNYGLVVDTKNPSASFDVVKKEYKEDAQPFTLENTPIELKAKGKRIAKWKQESNGLVGALQYSPVRSSEPVEDIILIPMGCARLRISAFPHISESPDANEWE